MMMRPPVDNHIFANEAEMKAHYAAVHKRLYDRPQKEKEDPKFVFRKENRFGKEFRYKTLFRWLRLFIKCRFLIFSKARFLRMSVCAM